MSRYDCHFGVCEEVLSPVISLAQDYIHQNDIVYIDPAFILRMKSMSMNYDEFTHNDVPSMVSVAAFSSWLQCSRLDFSKRFATAAR